MMVVSQTITTTTTMGFPFPVSVSRQSLELLVKQEHEEAKKRMKQKDIERGIEESELFKRLEKKFPDEDKFQIHMRFMYQAIDGSHPSDILKKFIESDAVEKDDDYLVSVDNFSDGCKDYCDKNCLPYKEISNEYLLEHGLSTIKLPGCKFCKKRFFVNCCDKYGKNNQTTLTFIKGIRLQGTNDSEKNSLDLFFETHVLPGGVKDECPSQTLDKKYARFCAEKNYKILKITPDFLDSHNLAKTGKNIQTCWGCDKRHKKGCCIDYKPNNRRPLQFIIGIKFKEQDTSDSTEPSAKRLKTEKQ